MRKIVPFNNVLTFNTSVFEITAISLEHSLEKNEDELSGIFYISGEYKILNGGINPEKFSFELPFDIALGMRYDMRSMIVDIDDFRYELIDNNKMKVNIDLYIDGEEIEEEVKEVLNVQEKLDKSIKEGEDEPAPAEESLKSSGVSEDNCEQENTRCEEVEVEVENESEEDYEEEYENTNFLEGENNMDNVNEEVLENDKVKDTMENDIKRESEIVKDFIYNDEIKSQEKIIDIDNDTLLENNNILNNLNDEERYVTYKVYRIVDGDTIDSILTKYKVSKEELLNYNENISDLKAGDKLIIPYK